VSARGGNAEVVIEWNRLLQTTTPTVAINAMRSYAMLHIAIFDAVNSIEREFTPYRVRFRQPSGGSAATAAAHAAHDVLTGLIPAQQPAYDEALAKQLGKHPSDYVRRGAAVGARVAKEILAWRENDGWNAATPPYVVPQLPGLWQSTPPNLPAATFPHLQSVPPMALLTATQFLPPAPPTLTSERYATDFNEAKLLGKSDSTERTPLQTEIALLWANVALSRAPGATTTNLWQIWNNIVRDLAREHELSLVETARLFALVNVSMHDGLQTTQASKFVYHTWRPVTAIRAADTDLNDKTEADATWLSLLTTPPYPSYGGNMAGVGASAATALKLAFGTDDIPFTATWTQSDGAPDITHRFSGFWEAAEEQANSRIYGGIHYRFDSEAGQEVGRKTARFVFEHYMTPRERWDN
jgi:hypothetical protein